MKCFVVMPFGNPTVDARRAQQLDHIYSECIKPVVEAAKIPGRDGCTLKCHRADKDMRPGNILTDIIEHLVTADIVIADLSGKNPNVFYELGVRHAVQNNTILIADSIDDIPFDLKSMRTISYKYDPHDLIAFRGRLAQAIRTILEESPRADNPVREFLWKREANKILSSQTPPGYDAIKSLISEFSSLKADFTKKFEEIRHVVEQVTSSQSTVGTKSGDSDFKIFEGVWRSSQSGSLLCARVINGELDVPYAYGGSDELTGHYCNFRRFGDALFARFEWFNSPISGYGHWRIVSKDKLDGGWWFSEDVPKEALGDPARMHELVPQIQKATLVRDKKTKKFPAWAESYFAKVVRKTSTH